MNTELLILCGAALGIGVGHTATGPDHYLPFIVLSKARGWSLPRTMTVTALCGVGHVLSSVVLGFIGVALGIAVFRLEGVEGFRGNVAAWLLIGFGLAYCLWGIRQAFRNRTHEHAHEHEGEARHTHSHSHFREHTHAHAADGKRLTPWILFLIFVFGPCEPLIPVLMYPAAKNSVSGLLLVTGVFLVATVGTMSLIVLGSAWGLKFVPLARMERYAHAMAGAMICMSGLAIQLLGL